MAGDSNRKFLTPFDFKNTGENIAAKTTTDNAKLVLLPPSTYENVKTTNNQRTDREKAKQNTSTFKNDKSKKILGLGHDGFSEEKESLRKTEKDEFLHSELQKARQKISDLEQENEVLLYELQDREALSEVVCQLKKDLRKLKEKQLVQNKDVSDKTQEYLETIKCLKTDIREGESKFSSLRQSYARSVEDVQLLDETNVYLKRKIEAKDLDFETVVRAKEQEIHEAEVKLKEVLSERDLMSNILTQLKEKYKKLEESRRQVRDD